MIRSSSSLLGVAPSAAKARVRLAMQSGGNVASVARVFFSSRRRHSRFDCDWSSDVCSSDLLAMVLIHVRQLILVAAAAREGPHGPAVDLPWAAHPEAEVNRALVADEDVCGNEQIGRASCRERG